MCGLSGLGFLQHDGWVLGESPLKINIPETQVEAERLLMIHPYKSPNITSTWLFSSKVSHRPSPNSRGRWYERMWMLEAWLIEGWGHLWKQLSDNIYRYMFTEFKSKLKNHIHRDKSFIALQWRQKCLEIVLQFFFSILELLNTGKKQINRMTDI